MKKFTIVLLSVLVSIVLGIVATLASIVGGSLFENTARETLGGCVAVVLYCVACRFWLSRRAGGGFKAGWPTLLGMLDSLLAACVLLVEGGIFHNWPMLISGAIGSFHWSPAVHSAKEHRMISTSPNHGIQPMRASRSVSSNLHLSGGWLALLMVVVPQQAHTTKYDYENKRTPKGKFDKR